MLRFVIICLFLLMPSSAESATVDRADIDINGVVDIHDFIAFAGSFGKHVLSPLPSYILWSDLDGNGRVDFADFLEFIPWFGHKLSRAEMGITLTSFPDTVRIGKPESLDVLIEQNKIRCDVVTLSLDLLDHPDSIAVSAIPVDDYGSHLNASRVTVAANGNLGNHRLVVGISYCLRAVRDTFHFVVIPVADPFIGK